MPGLYLHIPFCRARCGYCDFTTYTGKELLMPAYIEALEEEVRIELKGEIPETIFIGGGTPTSLDDRSFERLMAIVRSLAKKDSQEITIEANPESVTPAKIALMQRGGINRVSMGLQSTDNHLLREIGRIHSYEKFLESYTLLREAGFDNLSFDLITGLPGQEEDVIRDTIQKAVALQPDHLSVYSMILEEGTPFFSRHEAGQLKLPDDETDRRFQDLFIDGLEAAGFHRYEISNFARPGRESRHNLNYWNFGDYYACGVAASAFLTGIRRTNTGSVEEYIDGIRKGREVWQDRHVNSLEDSMEEFVFLGLRKTTGISLSEFRDRFRKDFYLIYGEIPRRFLERELMVLEGDRLRLTRRGMDISNYILANFILT